MPIASTPTSGTAPTGELELSSIFHPSSSTAVAPKLVTSNQSAAYGASPLPHGATSDTNSVFAFVPGEPVSRPSAETNAPFTPAVLRSEIAGSGSVVDPTPVVLSNVRPLVETAERDSGDPFPERVEDVHGVATGTQPDAAAAVGADGESGRGCRAEPGRGERRLPSRRHLR